MCNKITTKFSYGLILFVIIFIKTYASFFSTLPNNVQIAPREYHYFNQDDVPVLDSVYSLEVKFKGITNNKRKCLATLINVSDQSLYLVTAKFCFYFRNNKVDISKIREISITDQHGTINNMPLGSKQNQYTIIERNHSIPNRDFDDGQIITFTIQKNDEARSRFPFLMNPSSFSIHSIYNIILDKDKAVSLVKNNDWDLYNVKINPNSEFKYLTPQIIKEEGYSKFILSELKNDNFYIKKSDNSASPFMNLFYNDSILDHEFKRSFDSFVSNDIGGPLFQCRRYQQIYYCNLVAINVGAIVIPFLNNKTLKSPPLVSFGGFTKENGKYCEILQGINSRIVIIEFSDSRYLSNSSYVVENSRKENKNSTFTQLYLIYNGSRTVTNAECYHSYETGDTLIIKGRSISPINKDIDGNLFIFDN